MAEGKKALFDLTDKVAIVTGASKGIGQSIAEALADCGAKVVVSSRKQDAVDAVAAGIKSAGGEASAVECHVGDADARKALVDRTVELYGTVDILVNNAATNPVFGPALMVQESAFDKIMDVNVKAPFELAKLVQPMMMKKNEGSIINISSVGGIRPEPMLGIYSVSKFALNGLTKVLAKEWGGAGIRVNSICPGVVKTKFSRAIWENDAILKHATEQLPLARIADPDEICGVAVFLASPAASYVTGAIYTVDGGHTI